MKSDALNLLSKLTSRRALNALKVLLSYYLSRWLRRPIQWGVPITVSIEPTTACNLRCPECPSGLRAFTRPTGSLKADFFRQVIDELGRDATFLIFYFQGEPYLNPRFLEMTRYAAQRGLYTITSTNGHFLDDDKAEATVRSGLDRLIISLDGVTQEVYEQYRRGGRLETVLDGARNIVKWKRALGSAKPHLIFQFLVLRPNESQMAAARRLGREIGVDEVKFKTAQLYDYQNGHELIPLDERYSRYARQPGGGYRIKNRLLNHCWKLWHACVITWDGAVVPCCFDKDAKYRMGHLQRQSFRSLWHGELYRHFRQKILSGRDRIDICTNCTEGCRVWGEN
jgi:radical SAM protein with 4Fe4S-binding SPASM domain